MGDLPVPAFARRPFRPLVAVAALASTSVGIAHAQADDPGSIVVVGDRIDKADAAAQQGDLVTLRPPIDSPLPRRYAPICVKLFGIDPAYGALIAQQIARNAKAVGRPVAKPGCQPNVWIAFLSDSKAQVAQLRKLDPAMFDTLQSYEIERIFSGSGAAQVWHSTELRSADGRPIPIVELNIPGLSGRKIETGYNSQYSGGRLVSPIRNDINATIVVFDRDRANGKTVRQLADYATMRIFAPVRDFDAVPPDVVPTILLLFTPGADAPEGLTEFDWAYLSAYYKLDRGAKPSAVHDATRRAMLDGTGQKLNEKAAQDGQGLTSPP